MHIDRESLAQQCFRKHSDSWICQDADNFICRASAWAHIDRESLAQRMLADSQDQCLILWAREKERREEVMYKAEWRIAAGRVSWKR